MSEEVQEKPKCQLTGENGNIFNLLAIAARALKRAKMADKAEEMRERVFASESYDSALCIIREYVDAE